MARLNVDILGTSELKWTGMGEFNSDGHNRRQKQYGPNRKDIKKRWQEYTEELYKKISSWKKKIFMTQITTMVWSLT